MHITAEQVTDVVVEAFSRTPDPRLREMLRSLTGHLHDFVREMDPTMAEWEIVIDFLTRTGQKCDDKRQEFNLLSDVFGVTSLVENLESRRTNQGATATTVLGPFHMVASPPRQLGDTIALIGEAMPCVVEGQVTDVHGLPLPGATVDVWQADDKGFYDVQLPEDVPVGNGRGLFTADIDGRFWFVTVTPSVYPIPTDGPVGELLTLTKRHPYRPAHIHFIAAAEGHHAVTTHAFVAGSPYIDSDAVFAVKSSLVMDFATVNDSHAAARYGVSSPFRRLQFDIKLAPILTVP